MYTYFKEEEMARCNPPCHLSDMNPEFMRRLEFARTIADTPFILNSAFRCTKWDKNKGRSGKGMHTLGRAVDIRCGDSRQRSKIVTSLIDAGFTGLGIATTFIHVDNRETPNMWLY